MSEMLVRARGISTVYYDVENPPSPGRGFPGAGARRERLRSRRGWGDGEGIRAKSFCQSYVLFDSMNVRRSAMRIEALPLSRRLIIFVLLSAAVVEDRAILRLWRALTDPQIDLLLFIGGGVLTAFLAILGGHVATEKPLYRWLFYSSGAALSAIIIVTGIRNYRTALHAKTPEQIVMTAVDTADRHTDDAIAQVKEQLQASTKHADEQISNVRTDLKNAAEAFAGVVDKRTNEIADNLESLRPKPPQIAKIQFSYWVNGIDQFPLLIEPLHLGAS